ncbi:MAG: hypothetical protein RL757_2860 [Bacteroidota bacterium]|jgi:prephenate dehydratase
MSNVKTAESSRKTAQSSPLRVGIQGVEGAFHEIAARAYFDAFDQAARDKITVAPAETFRDLVQMVESGETDTAMMAIENTIAGSLLSNYNLLNNSDLYITGEIFLKIQQNLMALPNQTISDLREVHSHPIALQQCVDFFEKFPHIRLIEATDTALVAQQIREKNLKGIGAIGSSLAAECYNLPMLAESIETYKKNFTRFLVLKRKNDRPMLEKNAAYWGGGISLKTSIVFTTSHVVGSLYKVLEILAKNQVNLTKIQSAPIMDKPWEYSFFVDFTAQSLQQSELALQAIAPLTGELKILGKYDSGKYF